MPRQLNIAGKNSNEIYTLFYPQNLMNFLRYDFSLFLEHCTDLCRLAARTGEYNIDDVYSIRNSISACHKYYEQNMRTVFEKIVVDCWIDYLCRQSEVGTNTLWQSFMKCRNPFETVIFERLSDFRYNRAINEWTNLLRMQDYAREKTEFVFGIDIRSSQQAVARSNYFDLLFNVAANEQGFPIGEIASTNIFSVGRLPNSPFVMNSAAKEIARNQLRDMEYHENYKSRKNPDLTDKIAMDAFAAVKQYIPEKNDSMATTIIKSLSSSSSYVYVPGSFKAIIDLEIDIAAREGVYVQRCARCGDYFIRDIDYDFKYCSRVQREGVTCLELMKGEDPELAEAISTTAVSKTVSESDDGDPKIIYIDKDTVTAKLDSLYKEMAARVNVDLTQRDFSLWYQRALHLKDNILLGEAGEKELNDFIELSRGNEFASKKQPPLFEHKPSDKDEENDEEEMTENGKPVKKFVFEKVDRSAVANISSPAPAMSSVVESEKAAMEAVRKLFGSEQAKNRTPGNVQPRNGQQYDPAGMSYPYPQQYPQTGPQGYPNNPQYGNPQFTSFSQYYRQSPRQGTARIIKGGAAQQETNSRPKTVVIPNGDKERPVYSTPNNSNTANNIQNVQRYNNTKTGTDNYSAAKALKLEPEEDVKVFTPRRNTFIGKDRKNDDFIEPSPYEKLKQPLEEFRNERRTAEKEEEVAGQILTEELIRPAPSAIPASAAAAYKGYGAGNSAVSDEEFQKADFSHILEGIKREDGFTREENAIDSDGLPVSHKTKHVMNALFGPTKVSPILRVKLDEDDDDV